MTETEQDTEDASSMFVEISSEWPVSEQIELAQEYDEKASSAREINHKAYGIVRREAFQIRQKARERVKNE